MKNLIYLLLMVLLPMLALANEDVPPPFLKDGVISVSTKDGKESKFSANEWKVVRRGSAKKAPPPVVKPLPFCTHDEILIVEKETVKNNKNIVSLELVRSQNGLEKGYSSTTTSVSNKYELGVGVMYQRNIIDNVYLGGRVDTNSGAGVNVGLGF